MRSESFKNDTLQFLWQLTNQLRAFIVFTRSGGGDARLRSNLAAVITKSEVPSRVIYFVVNKRRHSKIKYMYNSQESGTKQEGGNRLMQTIKKSMSGSNAMSVKTSVQICVPCKC